ncbi:MAG: EamA family transporter [candidate division Zixibacteria bacterium]|nr:EamA family transporter [candidate division Zixibacteria bacterium]NIR63341.1 EamA family transporter [candidate division Zixibacteria bacterium]NIS17350.1 EamA family transporter [candidate division Zixibacteria bacterium]NIS45323.1 EamA family transporter [candidate division Zixibacteria bacterium]NIT53695.1 EamA family transporter [candidate division Zixibacteria bacterium]
MSSVRLYSIILFGQLVFAATPLFLKIALRDFDPLTLGITRFVISIIILNIFLFIQGRKIIPDKKHWLWIAGLGFLAIPCNQGLLFYGLQFTTPGHAALMYGMTPVLVYLFAIPLLKEKFRISKMLGIILAFAGVVIVLSDRQITIEPEFVKGDLIIFVGVIAWALYTVFGKSLVAKLGSILAITYTMTYGTILFIPIGAYNTLTFDFGHVDFLPWMALLYTAVITSGIAYPLWFWALKYLEASKLSVFIFLQPLLATILSYIFLSEQLTRNFVAGGIIVLGGVFIAERNNRIKLIPDHSRP